MQIFIQLAVAWTNSLHAWLVWPQAQPANTRQLGEHTTIQPVWTDSSQTDAQSELCDRSINIYYVY